MKNVKSALSAAAISLSACAGINANQEPVQAKTISIPAMQVDNAEPIEISKHVNTDLTTALEGLDTKYMGIQSRNDSNYIYAVSCDEGASSGAFDKAKYIVEFYLCPDTYFNSKSFHSVSVEPTRESVVNDTICIEVKTPRNYICNYEKKEIPTPSL
jgi:hypothetical protein